MNSFLSQVDPRITEAEVTLSGTTITVLGPTDGAPLLNPGRTGAAVTYTAVDTPTGPYHDSNAANYSGGAVPSNGDTLYFRGGDNLMGPRYGTGLSAVALAAVIVERSYAGRIGLPDNRGGYQEFREKRIYSLAELITVDNGNRGTIDRLRFGLAGRAIINAASDNRVAALDVAGLTGAGSVISLTNCGLNLGVDTVAGAGKTVDSITGQNVNVVIGPGYTVTDLDVASSAVELRGVVTTAELDASILTVAGTLTNGNVYNGSSVGFKTSASPTSLDVVSSVVDYSAATGAITPPTVNIGGTSSIVDPFGRLTEPWAFTLYEGTGLESLSIITPKTGRQVTIG